MPRDALPAGARPPTLERSVRLLACEFPVSVDCPEVLARLDALLPHAVQQHPVSRVHRLAAWRVDGGYAVHEGGREPEPCPDAAAAVRALYWRMHERALAALAGFTRLHAGCASLGGKRLLAAGPAGSGKSTLMARLLHEGFAVHGDDLVLLRGGEALPYPRRFFLRPGTLALVPALAARRAPRFEWDGWEAGSVALDPSELGFEWRIAPAPVDAVVFLERDAAGTARLEPCPRYAMAERLMSQSSQPAGGPGAWARDVSAMLDRASCYVLRSGDLEGSVHAVKAVLQDVSPGQGGR